MIGRVLNSFVVLGVPVLAQSAGQSWPPAVNDNEIRYFIMFTQLEGRVIGPPPTFRWDGEGWIGTNDNKLWIKSEGDVTSGTVSDGDSRLAAGGRFGAALAWRATSFVGVVGGGDLSYTGQPIEIRVESRSAERVSAFDNQTAQSFRDVGHTFSISLKRARAFNRATRLSS